MHVNVWAVLVSAVASMVVGSLWYGPLFGKQFMSAVGMDKWSKEKQAEMKASMGLTYLWQFIASVLMFYVLAVFLVDLHAVGAGSGLCFAFLAWLGFILPMKFGNELWGGKMSLFWIGASSSLVTMLVGGLILGVWR